jgi:hypothetical protein
MPINFEFLDRIDGVYVLLGFLNADLCDDETLKVIEFSSRISDILKGRKLLKCRCGKFFLARRIDQRHCSTNCRVREHQSSDEFKEKRRIYDRRHYAKKTGRMMG